MGYGGQWMPMLELNLSRKSGWGCNNPRYEQEGVGLMVTPREGMEQTALGCEQ